MVSNLDAERQSLLTFASLMIWCSFVKATFLRHCTQTFFRASGLQANVSKSAMYTIGITPETNKAIGELTHFPFGTFPLRYLDIPLSTKRLSIAECEQLANKMTNRIRGWQAKKTLIFSKALADNLSYDGYLFLLVSDVYPSKNSHQMYYWHIQNLLMVWHRRFPQIRECELKKGL